MLHAQFDQDKGCGPNTHACPAADLRRYSCAFASWLMLGLNVTPSGYQLASSAILHGYGVHRRMLPTYTLDCMVCICKSWPCWGHATPSRGVHGMEEQKTDRHAYIKAACMHIYTCFCMHIWHVIIEKHLHCPNHTAYRCGLDYKE